MDLHANAAILNGGSRENTASDACRLRRVFDDVGQNGPDAVGVGDSCWETSLKLEIITNLRMARLQKRDALLHDRIDVQHGRLERRIARELGKCADATFQRFHLTDDNLSSF